MEAGTSAEGQAATSDSGDWEIPLYARLGLEVGAAEWLRVALGQTWVQGSSPAVFVSYRTLDERWRFQLERFLAPELAQLSCPSTLERYHVWSFASRERGTATGSQYPEELVRQLWQCRAAIIVLSQDYLNSEICSATELPFLAWRHVAHSMPLYVLQVGVVSAAATVIPLPQVNGTWPDFDLKKQTNDTFPGLDHRERKLARQPNIFDLKRPDRDRRLVAFAELVRGNLAEHHGWATKSKSQSTRNQPGSFENRKTSVQCKSVGALPPIRGFEGRVAERKLLTEVLSHRNIGVVSLCHIGGAGKTCLALQAIEDLLDKDPPPFEAVFLFTFYGGRSQDEFMHELGMFISDALYEYRPSEGIEAWLLEVLRRRSVLLLLDGMEVIQSSSHEVGVGALQQGGVRTLLLWLCNQTAVCSTALVTSRLDLRELLPSRGGRYQPIELPALSLDDGARVLQRQGVHAPIPVLREIVTELSGHPLALMVFANSVQRVKTTRTNAVAVVLRNAQISASANLDAKLGRLLAYYQKVIDETDRRLIAAVTVFPDGAPADWLRKLFTEDAERRPKRPLPAEQFAERLDRLARDGILQAVPTLSRTDYTAHPIIRESFRVAASGLVETAAQLHLSMRPSFFVPRTGREATSYVRAVEIYCENGDFVAAGKVMSSHLEDGQALSRLGEWHLLFKLLWQFVQPDRRTQCQAALGRERFAGLLLLTIDACIALYEWDICGQLCALGANFLGPIQLAGKQAAIQEHVGSLTEAERLLRLATARSSSFEKLAFEPKLANVLFQQGRLREAWRLLRNWIRYRPRTLDELVTWIWNWSEIALCSARLWSRVEVGISERFLNAMDKVAPVLPIHAPGRKALLEWEQLRLVPREHLTPEQWLRLLELARILGDEAARVSRKDADGGWMVGILLSLNGLKQYENALSNIPIIVSQLHERSFYRPWVDIEAAIAHAALGRVNLAREMAGSAMKQALSSGNILIAQRAATLLLELPKASAPIADDILARQIFEGIEDDTLFEKEFDLGIPLPGEEQWDNHLATLLTECVSETSADGASSPDFALQLAARVGIAAAVPTILARGSRPLFGDNIKGLPMKLAVEGGHTEVVRALLEAFGALDLSDAIQGNIALLAIERCNLDIAELLLRGAANCTREWLSEALVRVAMNGDERLLDLMLQHGADPAVATPDGSLPIVVAAGSGNVAILLRLASMTSVSSVAPDGQTPLIAAVANHRLRVIDLLAEMNADLNQPDHEGHSVADVAAKSGYVQLLIRLATRFNQQIDWDRHLLPALDFAEKFACDWELRFMLTWVDSLAGRKLNVPNLKPRIRAALKRVAAERKMMPDELSLTPTGMNLVLTLNARAQMMILHNQPLAGVPLWVGYHVDYQRIAIMLDNGATVACSFSFAGNTVPHHQILKSEKVLIVRVENKKPVEGYSIPFLKLRGGKAIA